MGDIGHSSLDAHMLRLPILWIASVMSSAFLVVEEAGPSTYDRSASNLLGGASEMITDFDGNPTGQLSPASPSTSTDPAPTWI